jgi:gas vesicle protein
MTPFEDMLNTMMETQKKMWDSFFQTMQGMGKSQSARAWEQTVSVGEEILKSTFKAQSDMVQAWSKSLAAMPGVPPQTLEAAKQFQEMYQRWSETQERLWANWFEMLKKFDPTKVMGAWPEAPQNPFQVWQDTTQKIMDAQLEWMRASQSAGKSSK